MRIGTLTVAVFLAACHAPQEAPPEPKAKDGRAETQAIRNTDAIGVKGSLIADQVDATLNANDQRNRELEEAQRDGATAE